MLKVSAPYKEGIAWCLRWRGKGEDIFVSGQSLPKAAREEIKRLKRAYGGHFQPKGLGPAETTLGQALLEFGEETFPFLKGAAQECRLGRINWSQGRLPTLTEGLRRFQHSLVVGVPGLYGGHRVGSLWRLWGLRGAAALG